MDIEESLRGNAVILKPSGRLDSSSTSIMQDRVQATMAKRPKHLVIDFTAVDYVNSTGLRVMLMAAKKMKLDGGRLTLCGMRPNVREVFVISGFHKIIEIVDECAGLTGAT